MGLLSSGRLYKQYAVYWQKTGDVDDSGQPVYTQPRVIKVRWEDRHEEFVDNKGDAKVSKSIVYIPEELSLEGFLWKSRVKPPDPEEAVMADLTSWILENNLTIELNDADSVPDAWQIQRIDIIPDLKARDKHTLRIAIL